MFDFLVKIMSDSDQNPSSMRIVMLAGAALIFLTWAVCCFKQGALIPFDETHLAALGILLGGKVIQSGIEKKGCTQ